MEKKWFIDGNAREECAMRHENGNCLPCGGFCLSVNDEICKALHNAFKSGEQSKIEWATLAIAKQSAMYEQKSLEVLRKIHERVTAPTVDAVEMVRCKDCLFIIDREDGTHGCYRHFVEDCKLDDFCSYGEK